MTYKGVIKKSRTYDLAAIIAVLATAQAFIPQFDISQNAITGIGLTIAVLIAILRHITKGPVGVK